MTKSILLTWSSVCFCIFSGFFNSAMEKILTEDSYCITLMQTNLQGTKNWCLFFHLMIGIV